jgi:probable aminopeptidase NPEPL1
MIAEYRPRGAKSHVVLVGKGVVYDTGGLNIKTGGNMYGMKGDMGGGAAVVGAFKSLVAGKSKHRVTCLVPLAENAVSSASYRPNDILHMHSGKTVEINNTDAEGRLLLADGVSYAARVLKADVIIDAATLTGAQLVATGRRHAAIVSNREGLEQLAVESGRSSGDLTHPLPFAPEFFQAEFKSVVADMRNSVKDRANAQSSCAGQFVYSHIQDLDVPWLHIDLAGPAQNGQRATGFGVALISELVERLTSRALKS